jgi:hypothetical protein
MSEDAKIKNARDQNHLTIMPIQASLNPSPAYRRPAIAIIESLRPSQIKELVRQNKENVDYVKDLKFFSNFSALPQARSAEVLSENIQQNLDNDLNLDKRLQRVLQVSSASIPPAILAAQYRPNESIVEKLLNTVFSIGEKATSKNAPKPALTPGPSPFDNSGESEEERKRKEKLKQGYSSPSPM